MVTIGRSLMTKPKLIMLEGTIKAHGTPEEVQASDEIREAYLGL